MQQMLEIFQLKLDDMRYGLMSSIQSKIFLKRAACSADGGND